MPVNKADYTFGLVCYSVLVCGGTVFGTAC